MTTFIRREDALPGGHRFDGSHAEVLVHRRTDDVCLAMVISSNACLDVLAVHDDAVAGPHRTTVPCSVDGGPRARNEPATQRETCLHRIALVVEHPGRRVAVVEVRMVVTRGVVSPVPGEHVFRIAREPRPRELPARVNLLERRTGVETAERDDVDVAEPSPGGQCGVVRGRDEVCLKMSCKSQYQALCASDRFQVVVEDGNLHAVTRAFARRASRPLASRELIGRWRPPPRSLLATWTLGEPSIVPFPASILRWRVPTARDRMRAGGDLPPECRRGR